MSVSGKTDRGARGDKDCLLFDSHSSHLLDSKVEFVM